VKDLVKDTKKDGAKGVVTGTGSLMKRTVAGTLGDGIGSLTTDKGYLKKRE